MKRKRVRTEKKRVRYLNAVPRSEREVLDRERALEALALMRRDKVSLRAAARAGETDSDTVKRYVGSALWIDKGGHYRATRYDRIPRTVNFVTATGPIPIQVRDSRTASRIATYSNAERKYRRTGDTSALAQFEKKSFRADGVVYHFLTDIDALDVLVDAGLPIENLYYARVAE